MAQMTGADAADLERGASSLEAFAKQVGGMRKPMRHQLQTSPWNGRAADRFRQEWDSRHGPALSEAEAFLRNAGRKLRDEANEQRRASDQGGGGRGSTGVPGGRSADISPDSEALEQIRGWLAEIGVPIALISEILGRLRLLDELDALAGPLQWLASNEEIEKALGAAGDALKLADMVMDFLSVIAANEHLPMDERIVLATTTLAVGIAVTAGIKVGTQVVGGMIGSAIGGPVGTVAGKLVGEVVGKLLKEGVDALDDRFDITEQIAEQALDGYRFAKDRDFDVARIAWDASFEAASAVADAAQNLTQGAQKAVGEMGRNIADGAKNIADGAQDVGRSIWSAGSGVLDAVTPW